MACAFPFVIKKKLSSGDTVDYQVPCGWCLNCRVDKRNQWSDRCKYELCQYKVGSFVTLTYDDNHLSYVKQYDGKLTATLDYSDVRKFIQRLRKYIINHPKFQSLYIRPDFKYLYVGEYGGEGQVFDRPHYHILFFGLDYAHIKRLVFERWQKGFCDCLPILDGGINYVLKYMDKQAHASEAFYKYDVNFLERPKQFQSIGLGKGLYFDTKERQKDIVENNFTYLTSHNIRRPVPNYYKKKFKDSRHLTVKDDTELERKMKSYNLRDFSVHAKETFKRSQARIKERMHYFDNLNNGIACFDNVGLYYNSIYNRHPDNFLVTRALADEYIDNLKDCLKFFEEVKNEHF